MPIATLTMTGPVALRVGTALGKTLGLKEADGITPKPATMGEFEDWLRDVTRRMVMGQEVQDAHRVVDITPPVIPLIT